MFWYRFTRKQLISQKAARRSNRRCGKSWASLKWKSTAGKRHCILHLLLISCYASEKTTNAKASDIFSVHDDDDGNEAEEKMYDRSTEEAEAGTSGSHQQRRWPRRRRKLIHLVSSLGVTLWSFAIWICALYFAVIVLSTVLPSMRYLCNFICLDWPPPSRRRLVLIPSPSPLPPFLSEMLPSCRYVAARPFAQSLSITVVLMHVYLCHVDRVEIKWNYIYY